MAEMREGLLWFDDDPKRSLAQKVGRAVRRYRQKFGRPPNVCYVHPSLLDGKVRRVDGVMVLPLPSVLRHHFWVGVKEVKGRNGRSARPQGGRARSPATGSPA
ncbi:MAG TPA: hypothetical protein G4O00_00700 [Thermoflexia bacterium]|jgi:hypothetical protein|nr:hypothetical protein [Thermoflexia bacterium]